MPDGKSKQPEHRMGVYKHLDDVPDHHRLERHATEYEGRDVWATWAEQMRAKHSSERYAVHLDRTERSWKQHMDSRGRHHALGQPADVETWAAIILERCKPLSAYQIYYTKLESFYTWLQAQADHPHCYHPVWMAAADGGATRTIWDEKMRQRER